MPHADAPHPVPAPSDEASFAALPDEQNPAIRDAALMLWVVVGAIALWSAAIYFFIL